MCFEFVKIISSEVMHYLLVVNRGKAISQLSSTAYKKRRIKLMEITKTFKYLVKDTLIIKIFSLVE